MDKITRLIIYKFITTGFFDVIENVIATGKVKLYKGKKLYWKQKVYGREEMDC